MAAFNNQKGPDNTTDDPEDFISSDDVNSSAATATYMYNESSNFWKANLSHVSTIKTIRTRSDSSIPRVTGLCMMTDRQIILCDNSNSKVKFLDDNCRKIRNEIVCEYPPFDVATIDDEKVIVTMPDDKRLEMITMKPGVKLADKLNTSGQCYGIAVNDGNIYVCVDESDGSKTTEGSGNAPFRGVQVMSLSGKLLCAVTHSGSGIPRNLCINMDGTKICCSGGTGKDAFVTCYLKEGHALFKISDEIQTPSSVIMDREENTMVVDNTTNKIYAINADGVSSKCVLSGSKTTAFTSMCFSSRYQTLLVSCSTDGIQTAHTEQQMSKIKMYKLSNPSGRLFNSNPTGRLVNSIRRKLRK